MLSAYLSLNVLAAFLFFFTDKSVLAGDTVHLDSLWGQCQFMVDGNTFNLCPMFELQKQDGWFIQYERKTPPSITTGQYRIKLDGKLAKNGSLEDNMQCPDGTTICLTTYTRYDGDSPADAKVLHTIPVAGTLDREVNQPFIQFGRYTPGLNVEAQMFRRWNTTDDSLRVTLHGGYFVDQKQYATIYFICDEDHSKSNLKHLWTFNGNHIFSWTSPYSCIQEAESTPPDSEDKEEQELAPPPLGSRTSRKMWTIVFFSTLATSGLVYLTFYPPRVVRRQAQKYFGNKPSLLRFRVGENVLVRWAHEDLDLEEVDGLMVQGDDVHGYLDAEEQIPLKPSPRKGGVLTYGSA